MKRLLFTTAAAMALAAAGPAAAADLPARTYTKAPAFVAAAYDWSGFYIGINGGGGFSHKCWGLTNNGVAAVIPSAPEGCHDASGATAGGQIGYRWQSAA
jgi:outer membrane immunogenic protein